jgi:succinate dehydrogenase flavin-adding protein (antitoxin of CptAB toxin-antitoxin module)
MNLSNENFKKRVGDIIGGQFILIECAGFKEEDGFLVLKDDKKDSYPKLLEAIDKEIFNLTG